MDFAVSLDHRVEIKESKKIDKYLDLAREQKKPWNPRVEVIPIEVRVFGLEEYEIGERIETTRTTALKSARIFKSNGDRRRLAVPFIPAKKLTRS